jgi:type I restriction enzyme M protein
MNPEIRSKLDRITQALFGGGVVNPVTYIEQLSYLIYLKLLDEEESNRELQARLVGKKANGESLFPLQASRYRWSEWRFKSGKELHTFVGEEVFPYMSSLLKESPQIAAYFKDARLAIEDPNVLKQVVSEIDSIQFGKLGTDIKGDIFEYLLTFLATKEGSLLGQFRTPRQIRKMMLALTDPDLGDSVFDPACGTGGFLIDAVEHILAKYSESPVEVPIYGEEWLEKRGQALAQAKKEIPNLQTYRKGPGEKLPDWRLMEHSIFGVDVSREMMRVAVMNLVLHGIRNAQVKRANALSETGGLTDEDMARKYKVILSNPPFAGALPDASIRQDLPVNSRRSEILFLGLMMQALAPGGRAAVVVPEGLLFGGSSAHVELRRKLVTDFEVLAVISLPAGVFKPYAGVKTAVVVFRRPVTATASKKLDKVWFYEVRNDGFDPDKVIGGGRVETPAENDLPDLLVRWQAYKKSGFRQPPGPEAGALLETGIKEPRCWWAEITRIADDGHSLAANRYRPQTQPEAPTENATDLVDELGRIESEIQRVLNQLRETIS